MTTARLARNSEIAAVSETLGLAFDDDPFTAHILPSDLRDRSARLRWFMSIPARTAARHRSLWIVDNVGAAAAWMPPDKWQATPLTTLRIAPWLIAGLRARLPIAAQVLNAVEKQHPREPHWYLEAVGTRPDQQGNGFGRAVIQPVLDRCDADGLPAYLESSKESNIGYYERFGFEVTGEIALPGDGPSIWSMWREPRTTIG